MELTKEYFDQGLANFLEKIEGRFAGIEAVMVTKDDLKTQTAELKQYVHESFETQQVWVDERFDELIAKYEVRGRVEKLEKDFKHFKLDHSHN